MFRSLVRSVSSVVTAVVLAASASSAGAQSAAATARVTADDVYALFFGTPSALTFLGTDNNWTNAETYNFTATAGGFVYIAAWDLTSLPLGGQALQALVTVTGGATIPTNATNWVATVINASSLPGWSAASTATPSTSSLQSALTGASWSAIGAASPSSSVFWGPVIPGTSVQWIWTDTFGASATNTRGQLVVFRTDVPLVSAIPEMGTTTMLALGLCAVGAWTARRRPSGRTPVGSAA